MSNMPEELFASKMEELERLMYTQMWNCFCANTRNYLISKYGQKEMNRKFAEMSTTFFDCADKYDLLSQVTCLSNMLCATYTELMTTKKPEGLECWSKGKKK